MLIGMQCALGMPGIGIHAAPHWPELALMHTTGQLLYAHHQSTTGSYMRNGQLCNLLPIMQQRALCSYRRFYKVCAVNCAIHTCSVCVSV